MSKELRLAEPLLRGKAPSDIEKIKDSYKAAPAYLKALSARIEKILDDAVTSSESLKQYSSPDWALYQADNRGYRRALREVLALMIHNKEQDKK